MRKNTLKRVVVMALVVRSLISTTNSSAQAITPDLTFGVNGVVNNTQPFHNVNTMCLQPDGKILVAGSAYTTNTYFDYAVARFNSDGSVDQTFGNAGFVTFDHGGVNNRIYTIALTSEGKILALGDSTTGSIGSGSRFIILRFNPNGSKDLTFGDGGMVIAPLAQRTDQPKVMQTTSDGKIVVAGISSYLPTFGSTQPVVRLLVGRLNPDGSQDLTFNETGYFVKVGGYVNNSNFALTIDAAGSIYVGCSKRRVGFVLGYPNVTKVLENGALDSGFGDNGEKGFLNISGSILDLNIRPDGKILTTGGSLSSGMFLQMLPNGDLDNTFGNNGIAVINNVSGATESGVKSILLEDGKVITGYQRGAAAGDYDLSLLLTNPDGTLNSLAGEGGFAISSQQGDQVTKAMTRQDDGKIIV